MRSRVFGLTALSAALMSGCMEEFPTLPPGIHLPSSSNQSSRKIVVTSSISEYVPSPALARELEACKTALSDSRSHLAESEGQLTGARSRLAELENQLAGARSRLAELETQAVRAAALEKQLAGEVQTGRDLQQRLSRVEQEAAQSKATEQRLMQELQTAQQKASESQAVNQQQIELAEQEISRRKAALAETTKHLATLDQDKQKIAAALSDSQQRVDVLTASLTAEQAKASALSQENQRLSQSYDSLKKSLETEIADRDLKLRQAQSRVVVTILDHVLFDSGQATLKPTGMKVLDQLSTALGKISDKEIHVEGHTDNRPIRGPLAKRYPTNWELSSARATTVVRYLIEQTGLPAASLSAVGLADTKPVATNDTEASRGENRRIEILLYPKGLPKTVQALNP